MRRLIILGIIVALSMTACGKSTQAETTPSTETTIETTTEIETTEAVTEATIEKKSIDEAMMNRIRQDVVDGVTRGSVIEEEVEMWCSDFLDDEQKAEFISELHLLEKDEAEVVVQPKETKAAKPKETQSSKPKETQPAPQETQPAPKETQAQPKETQSNNNSGGIDTSGWNTGGAKIDKTPLSEDQHLSPEQYDEINNIDFN